MDTVRQIKMWVIQAEVQRGCDRKGRTGSREEKRINVGEQQNKTHGAKQPKTKSGNSREIKHIRYDAASTQNYQCIGQQCNGHIQCDEGRKQAKIYEENRLPRVNCD